MHKLCGVLTCTRWASHSVRVVRRIRARIGLEEENNAEGDRQYLQFSPRVLLLSSPIFTIRKKTSWQLPIIVSFQKPTNDRLPDT